MAVFKALVFIVCAVLFQRLFRLAIIMGVHRTMFNHTPGPCHIIPGIEDGSEDITTLSNGIAFITSGLALVEAHVDTIRGRIFTFDFKRPEKTVREVEITGDSFNKTAMKPLGINAWEDPKTGKVTVFVVNHPLHPRTQSVEIFDYVKKTNTLRHKKTVISDAIYSPNDVVAMSADTFYVTNDMRLGRFGVVEILLTLPTGTVAYYNGHHVELVATGMAAANGISRSPDGKHVYVSGLMDAQLNVFKTMKDGSLTLLKKIDMHTSIDNINVDSVGDLWLGCHYQPYKLKLLDVDRSWGTAQVLRLHFDANLNPQVREVLADDGTLLQGSSVASIYGNMMLVGTIANKMMMIMLEVHRHVFNHTPGPCRIVPGIDDDDIFSGPPVSRAHVSGYGGRFSICRYVYMAGAFDGEIHIYDRNTDGSLMLLRKIDMHTAVDNIEVDRVTGDLWIGCHFQPYKLLYGDPNDRSKGPSQILRLKLDQDLRSDVRDVLADDGQLLKGSSVACKYGHSMLVGTIKNKMLYCDLLAF